MASDRDIIDRIQTILSRPGGASRNTELSAFLETAILSEDKDIRAFATKAWMSIGAVVFPLITCCDGDETAIDAAMSEIDVGEIEDSSEELFSTLRMTVDDASDLIRDTLRLREEARLKSGFYKAATNPSTPSGTEEPPQS